MSSMPVVTALYGSLNAIFNIALAARISRLRGKEGVSLGTGESKALLVAVRTHANNAEFVPLALVLLLLAELCGGSSLWLHVLGGSLLVSRVSHAIGMPMRAPNPFRFIGTGVTWLMIVCGAGYVLWLRTKS